MPSPKKPTVLFVAEAVTLAHFARIVSLAKSLDPSKYNIVIASDPRYLELQQPLPFSFQAIYSIPSSSFSEALAKGNPVYDADTLTQYVEDDLQLLDKIKPDLVVGDFRLSLSISAPLAKVPYAAVVNAYWSPYADISYPIPDLMLTKIVGVKLGQRLFNAVRPLVFALHARPLNKTRQRFGLPALKYDMRTAYTAADYTLYTDIPDAVPMQSTPSSHHHLGPVLWSTNTALPEWWDNLPTDKPIVFVTLGSSGQATLLPMILQALAELPLTIIAATVNKIQLNKLPDNVFIHDYLPLDIACQRSHAVISNGGSMTTYQAFRSGVPVIGIAGNMDQLLNMQAIEHMGAGITLRAGGITQASIKTAVNNLLHTPSYPQATKQITEKLRQYDPGQRFREIVTNILSLD